MNQRLVESVSQIILSMTDNERRLLERNLQQCGLQRLAEPEAVDKSLRVAELAQDIQEFEELYHPPLSELPASEWTASDPIPDAFSDAFPRPIPSELSSSPATASQPMSDHATAMPSAQGQAASQQDSQPVMPTPEVSVSSDSSASLQSFFQLTQRFQSDIADDDMNLSYALYDLPSEAPG